MAGAGIRQNAWVYVHPEALGQPASLGVDCERDMLLAEGPEVEELQAR